MERLHWRLMFWLAAGGLLAGCAKPLPPWPAQSCLIQCAAAQPDLLLERMACEDRCHDLAFVPPSGRVGPAMEDE